MYLTKNSHGVYYYRRPIVAEDQQFWMGAKGTPKKEWSRSLNTKDRRTAIAEMRFAEEAYEAERAAQYARYLSQPAAPQELSQQEREEKEALEAHEAARRQRFEDRRPVRVKVRQRWLLSTPELEREEAAARDLMRERDEQIMLLQNKLRELSAPDVVNEQPKAPVTVRTGGTATVAGAKTVSDLCDAYKVAKWDEWGESSRKAIGPVLRVLRETIGRREVGSVYREAARSVFEAVKLLPVNMGKRKEFAGLTVPQAIEKAQQLGLPTINPNTINRGYMVQIAAVFNWAVDEDWAVKNPFVGLSVADPVDDRDRRDAFTMAQMQTLGGTRRAVIVVPADCTPVS